jgi:hypothetical protein
LESHPDTFEQAEFDKFCGVGEPFLPFFRRQQARAGDVRRARVDALSYLDLVGSVLNTELEAVHGATRKKEELALLVGTE